MTNTQTDTHNDGLDITDRAMARVVAMANQFGSFIEGMGLRIMVKGGGCSGFTYDMNFDKQTSQDMVFERDGISIFIDPMSYQFVIGTCIDYTETSQYSGFNFDNPNATRTCGCGSSFAV